MRRGAELAVKDINAKGGVNGQQLRLTIADDACDPKQAVAVANQLATQGVVFVDGHYCSGSSIPASQVYHEAGVLQITPASNSSKLTEQGLENVFRTCGRDDVPGRLHRGLHRRQAARAADRDRPRPDDVRQGPRGPGQEAAQQARRAGGDVRGDQPGDRDFSALITKMKECQHRPRLLRRLPYRGRPLGPPGARAGADRDPDVRAPRSPTGSSGRSPARAARAR